MRLFLRAIPVLDSRQIAPNRVQKFTQPRHIVVAESREYRGLVDLREFIQRFQYGARGRGQIDAVSTAIFRMLAPLKIPFSTEAIDQAADGDFPHFEHL